jgi:hypothetical protein
MATAHSAANTMSVRVLTTFILLDPHGARSFGPRVTRH